MQHLEKIPERLQNLSTSNIKTLWLQLWQCVEQHIGSAQIKMQTRSSWLNCALRDDEAVYWVSIGHYEAVAVGN